jgi:hypothetical protein
MRLVLEFCGPGRRLASVEGRLGARVLADCVDTAALVRRGVQERKG